jgi:Domain of unknown function (DUF4177)
MQRFEYKVVPAPTRGEKVRTAKTGADRFAHALAQIMNALGREGWDYVRADTLPSEERTGFTGRTTVYHNMLVFRRGLDAEETVAAPSLSAQGLDLPQFTPPRINLTEGGVAPRLGPAVPITSTGPSAGSDEAAGPALRALPSQAG